MYTLTPLRIASVLLLYAALFVLIRSGKKRFDGNDQEVFLFIGLTWAISVFLGNYAFYRIGIMSFLPWINNFMHTFLWIGICLSYLYISLREKEPMPLQCLQFATFSLIVKYAEQMLFGTWEHDHFFFVFKGNLAYVLGWSLMDGLYPILTKYGLKLLAWMKFRWQLFRWLRWLTIV